ncbi:subtilisin-like protein [Cadophora sp. DSE1049]|nr:subtilisin-like protein [Cadophora sp. DSE1049]
MDTAGTLKMADVDKLHALGIKGKGMKIAFVDTGIDYTHPSLGRGFGPGYKVAGGFGFVQDGWDGRSEPISSPTPLTTCYAGGHGTHVAGIAGMVDPPNTGFGMIGVAPEASIYMYRVFSCVYDYTDDDIIMAAMIKAANDGVDVISMSLGSLNPFQGATPYTSLVNSITARGIAVVAANGNDGHIGTYGQSTPASVGTALAVGSVTNLKFPSAYTASGSDGNAYEYFSVWPLILPSALTVYSHGVLCTQSAWANTAAAYNKDPANIIVIAGVTRDCPLSSQMSGAAYYGIRYLIAYNVDQDPVSQDAELQIPFEVTTLVVDPRTGASILRKVKPGSTYKMSFTDPTVKSVRLSTGAMTSNFSSFGPTWDTVALKPQLSAPGGKILSTWPLGPYGGYAIISGTSMATPFVAACYALVRSQNLGLSVQQVISRMQATSEPMPYVYDHSFPSTVAGQGAGMVNPYKAIMYKTTITPSQLELKDLYIYDNAPQTIRIDNASPKAKTYTIKHQGAGYAEFFPYPDILESASGNAYGQPQYPIYGSASFDVTTVTIAAGGFYKLAVKFAPPKLTPSQIQQVPVFSGFIQISTSGEEFSVPYLGLPYDKRKTNAIDLSNVTIFDGVEEHKCAQPCVFNYPGLYDDDATWKVKINTQFETYNLTKWEFPNIYVNLLTGGADFEVHVLPGNTTFVPTHYGYDPNVETEEYMDPNHPPHDTFMGVPSYGWVPDRSQFNNAGPSETKYNFLPFTTSVTFLWEHWGEYLPPGDYRILISMLKPGIAEWHEDGWEHWLSPMIRLEGNWEDA